MGNYLTEPGTQHQVRAICTDKTGALWSSSELCGSFSLRGALYSGFLFFFLNTEEASVSVGNRKEPVVLNSGQQRIDPLWFVHSESGGQKAAWKAPAFPRCRSRGTPGFSEPGRIQLRLFQREGVKSWFILLNPFTAALSF